MTALHSSSILAIAHVLISIGISIRVIMRRPNTGVALAWLFIVAVLPFAGAVIYLFLGERRISPQRIRRIAARRADYTKLVKEGIDRGMTDVDWQRHGLEAQAMDRLGQNMVGIPTVRGSRGQLYSETHKILETITHDIDAARTSLLMEFYIWNEGARPMQCWKP